ncbi:LysR family transcriptional regulator [Caballeronia arationis]|nr:LysR family transcriptional regulator [Caballeronia arationis]
MPGSGTIPLAELAKEPFILIDLPHSRDFLMAPFWQFGLAPEVRYRATSMELVRGMVANGLGVSLLITQGATNTQVPGIVERPIREATVRQPLVIARATGAVHTQASGLVEECVREAVSEALNLRARRRRAP